MDATLTQLLQEVIDLNLKLHQVSAEYESLKAKLEGEASKRDD